MILKEQLNAEIKIGKIVKKDDTFIIEEYDKDGNCSIITSPSLGLIVDNFNAKSFIIPSPY